MQTYTAPRLAGKADSTCSQSKSELRLTIGQLARLSGIKAKTIRYYEEIGLLPPAQRRESGYRCYGEADVNRLLLLRRIRLLGVPLTEIRQLLSGCTASATTCADVQSTVLGLVSGRLIALDREIDELHLLREQVAGYHQQLAEYHQTMQQHPRICHDLSCIPEPLEDV